MAAFPNGNSLTRPDYAGVNSDVDIHMEEHLGIVDSKFVYTSKLAPFLDVRTLRNSNIIRLERVSAAVANGRSVGEPLIETQNRQEKYTLAVDKIIYVRNVIDSFDLWTQNRDYRREYAEQHGAELARKYDQAALIAAQKAPSFVPPASLGDAFAPGVLVTTDVADTDITEEAAEKLVQAHRKGIEDLINRDMGDALYDEGVTFVSPRVFSILLQHNKLMNVEFGASAGNDFARGRVAILNGIRVVESARVPSAAITGHPLGSAFDVSADEAKRQMITFLPSQSILVAQVKPLSAEPFYDPKTFGNFMTTYQSYNIGLRRPETVSIVAFK